MDANWKGNNVPYERRVLADLGNGKKIITGKYMRR